MPFPRNSAAVPFTPGVTGIIDRFTDERLAGKLLDIGVRPGARLSVVRKSPFGSCWYVKIDRNCLALRKHELACIRIK